MESGTPSWCPAHLNALPAVPGTYIGWEFSRNPGLKLTLLLVVCLPLEPYLRTERPGRLPWWQPRQAEAVLSPWSTLKRWVSHPHLHLLLRSHPTHKDRAHGALLFCFFFYCLYGNQCQIKRYQSLVIEITTTVSFLFNKGPSDAITWLILQLNSFFGTVINKSDTCLVLCSICIVKPVWKIKLDPIQNWQITLKNKNSGKIVLYCFFGMWVEWICSGFVFQT